MSHQLVVVDTNVVVSGMLTRDGASPPARVLDAMLAGRLSFVLSVDLLVEYRVVLLRPRVAARHRLSPTEVDAILERLSLTALLREPAPALSSPPDPGDAHLWALLAAVPGSVLVTGDAALLDSPPDGASVISPAALVGQLQI